MWIIYGISVLISFMLIKKTNKEIEVISFGGISLVLLLCFNAFVCYVFTFFRIPITAISLMTLNILLSIIMIFFIARSRQIQKYTLDKFGFFCVVIILIFTLRSIILRVWIPIFY